MASGKKRVVLYQRGDTNEEVSVGGAAIQKYAELRGYDVLGYNVDIGSGISMDRPGILTIMEVAKRGFVDAVVVQNVSRISRDAVDFLRMKQKLAKLNVELEVVEWFPEINLPPIFEKDAKMRMYENIFELSHLAYDLDQSGDILYGDSRTLFTAIVALAEQFEREHGQDEDYELDYISDVWAFGKPKLKEQFPAKPT